MKLRYYILLLIAVTLCGCKKGVYNNEDTAFIQFATTSINNVDVGVKNSGVMINNSDFGADVLALYAVRNNAGVADFSERFINVNNATVSAVEGAINYGAKVEFPGGDVSAFAIYPSATASGVEIVDPNTTVAPSANITLQTNSTNQYDIMLAKIDNLDRNEHMKGKNGETMTFKHALAQFKVKAYALAGVNGDKKITKVVVKANSKATLANITTPTFTALNTPVDFVLYENAAGINITGTTAETATDIAGQLMLFPDVATEIVVTIDGVDYKIELPDTYKLVQGGINTATIILHHLEVKFGGFSIAKWNAGTNSTNETEVIKRFTQLQLPIKNSRADYTPSGSKIEVEARINGSYWLTYEPANSAPVRRIPASINAGVLTLDAPVQTKMLTGEDIFLSDLNIYEDDVLIFSGKVSNYTPNGGKLLINQKTGEVTVNTLGVTCDIAFGNFGNGTADFPFEVSNAVELDNLRKFFVAGDKTVVYAVQTDDVNLSPHLLVDQDLNPRTVGSELKTIGGANGWIGLSATQDKPVYISYNGNNHTIRGLYAKDNGASDRLSLFGHIGVSSTSTLNSSVANLVVEGNIRSQGTYIGGVADYVYNTAFENCVNKVNIRANGGSYVGGLVGYYYNKIDLKNCGNKAHITLGVKVNGVGGVVGGVLQSANSTIVGCYNKGNVITESGTHSYIAGITAGYINTATALISDCYNEGRIIGDATYVGGIAARWTTSSMTNVYNNGLVSTNGTHKGFIIGNASATFTFNNNHYVDIAGSTTTQAVGNQAGIVAGVGLPSALTMNNDRTGDNAPWIDVEGVPRLKWETAK